VIKLKNDRGHCKQMGKNARKIAVTSYNRVQLAGRLEEVFMGALKET
jgi:hypothetical protein